MEQLKSFDAFRNQSQFLSTISMFNNSDILWMQARILISICMEAIGSFSVAEQNAIIGREESLSLNSKMASFALDSMLSQQNDGLAYDFQIRFLDFQNFQTNPSLFYAAEYYIDSIRYKQKDLAIQMYQQVYEAAKKCLTFHDYEFPLRIKIKQLQISVSNRKLKETLLRDCMKMHQQVEDKVKDEVKIESKLTQARWYIAKASKSRTAEYVDEESCSNAKSILGSILPLLETLSGYVYKSLKEVLLLMALMDIWLQNAESAARFIYQASKISKIEWKDHCFIDESDEKSLSKGLLHDIKASQKLGSISKDSSYILSPFNLSSEDELTMSINAEIEKDLVSKRQICDHFIFLQKELAKSSNGNESYWTRSCTHRLNQLTNSTKSRTIIQKILSEKLSQKKTACIQWIPVSQNDHAFDLPLDLRRETVVKNATSALNYQGVLYASFVQDKNIEIHTSFIISDEAIESLLIHAEFLLVNVKRGGTLQDAEKGPELKWQNLLNQLKSMFGSTKETADVYF